MNRFLLSWLRPAAIKSLARLGWIAAGWRGRIRRRPPALQASAAKLKSSTAELQLVSSALEKRFLVTSTALEQLAGKGESFIQLSEKLLNSATGRVGGSALFLNTVQVVEMPLDFLNQSHAKTCALLQRLRHANDRINEFINIQAELQRTIAPLKYIQTLFKIESAPLGENIQAMFGALTLEIEKLHDQICELFTTKFLELREIQRIVSQVIQELQTQTDRRREGIAREKAQIDQSLTQLHLELSENQKREPRISSVGREINQDIQRVVIGLQYQDIISQKLQHTFTALAHIEEHFESPHGAAILGQSCRLEAAQLAAIRQDLAGAETAVTSGVKNVLNRLVSADSQCLTLAEFQQLTTSADGMVEVLFDVFDTVRKQIAATATSSAAAFEKLRPIGGLASDLTLVVRDFSQRIHLIGLNAQVQAAQVGHGGALEALSARTSEISRATMHISENVARHLDQLVADLAEGVKELEALQDEALKQQSVLADKGAAAEKSLHALRDDTLATLLQVNTLIDEIRSESQSLIDGIDFVATADGPLAGLQGELQHIADFVGRTIMVAGAKPEALIEKLHGGYTMASERKVFARVVNGQTDGPAAPAENGAELFDDLAQKTSVNTPEPTAASQVALATVPTALPGGNVELF